MKSGIYFICVDIKVKHIYPPWPGIEPVSGLTVHKPNGLGLTMFIYLLIVSIRVIEEDTCTDNISINIYYALKCII